MTFDPTSPTASQLFSVSQPIIRDNFTKSNTDFGIDHLPFTTGAGAGNGQHKKITLNNVQADPVLLYPQSQIYDKNFGTAGPGPGLNHELYYSDTRELSPQLVKVIPTIKAICRFTVAPVGPQTIISTNSLNQNVTSVTRFNPTAFQVVFTTTLNYDTYFVYLEYEQNVTAVISLASRTGVNKTTTGFFFDCSAAPTNGNIIGFMVI